MSLDGEPTPCFVPGHSSPSPGRIYTISIILQLHRTLLHSTHEVAQDHKSPCVLQGVFAGHGSLRHQDMFVPKSQITTEAEVKFISRLVDNSTCSVTRLHSRELSLAIYDSEDNSTCIPAKTKHQGSLF